MIRTPMPLADELIQSVAPPAPTTAEPATTALRPTRRQFVVTAAGGLLLEFVLPGGSRIARAAAATSAADTTQLNAYIRIGADNTITVLFGGCELGQGAMSGLAQLVAEELMVDWADIQVATVQPGPISYITGGSSAIKNNYLAVRQAGAAVRSLLLTAAAQSWRVPVSQCVAVNGAIVHQPTGHTLSYGSLAGLAATLTPPANPPLVEDSKLRIIGQPVPRLDLAAKVNGSAVYGIDVRLPNMVYASVKHCPQLGGTVASMPHSSNNGSGVTYVNLGNAVAAVASNTYAAISAARGANVTWHVPLTAVAINSTLFDVASVAMMTLGPVVNAEVVGNSEAGMRTAAHILSATYSFPYLAHACMEVLNCTVNLTAHSCEIWAPTQAAAWVQATAATLTGLPTSSVTVHTTLLGGGLGRKIEQDYIAEAVKVAMAIKQPVKLTWSREEDFGHDMYRPLALTRINAGVDNKGNITGWQNRIISPSIQAQRGWVAAGAEDGQSTEGATALPYAMGSRLVEYGAHPSPVPIGFWRSVGCSYNAFAIESFIDELAGVAGVDPYVYRRNLLANNPRFLSVLDAAANLGNYNGRLPSGHARGIAIAEAFGTVVAEVVEISNATSTSVRLVSVAAAVDCGRVINPDSVKAQIESGILHGLSAALWGHITFNNGTASVSNFNNYRLLRMSEAPAITVDILPSTNAPTGAGEPGVPPAGPALANAYFKLTGNRVRTLPFFPGQSHMSDG